ncbi:hypothetical protein SprV_0200936900 [Sparganum proliferum]
MSVLRPAPGEEGILRIKAVRFGSRCFPGLTRCAEAYDRLHRRGSRQSTSQCPDEDNVDRSNNERNNSSSGPTGPSSQP